MDDIISIWVEGKTWWQQFKQPVLNLLKNQNRDILVYGLGMFAANNIYKPVETIMLVFQLFTLQKRYKFKKGFYTKLCHFSYLQGDKVSKGYWVPFSSFAYTVCI